MIVRDPIFEQHYQKQVAQHTQAAYHAGMMDGQALILNAITEFEVQKIPVTVDGLIAFLNSKALATANQIKEEQMPQERVKEESAKIPSMRNFEVIK